MVLSDIAFRRSLVKENEEKKVGKDERDTLYFLRRFGLNRWFGRTDKINVFWFALFKFGLIWFGYFSVKQINNGLISNNLICEFVFGYSTDKQTN